MSNCPQNTMKDWFAALFRALTLLGGELNRKPVSQGWNKDVLSAGKEGKTAHLAPVHQARKIGRRGKNTEDCDYMEKKRAHIYSSKRRHNTEWGWRGIRTSMNIKPLTSTRAWKSEPRQSSFAFLLHANKAVKERKKERKKTLKLSLFPFLLFPR